MFISDEDHIVFVRFLTDISTVFQVLSVGNLNPPNIQYSYTLALKETESINFIWKEDSEWTKCDDICNGRFVFN